MARSDAHGKSRASSSSTKVKTGCATCRIRRVKCDEGKPCCQRCVSSGRNCDGYDSPFIMYTNQALQTNQHGDGRTSTTQFASGNISAEDVELLNRYLSTKTMHSVELGCTQEARQILEASLTDPTIEHAVSSLKALREDLETSGVCVLPVNQQPRNYERALRQYNMALRGAVSNLSTLDLDGVKSALLCCQIFISIEQAQGNYAAMAQHMLRGLRIMHEYRARPTLSASKGLVPANHHQLPLLDVYLIKSLAASCKFSEPSVGTGNTMDLTSPAGPGFLSEQAEEAGNFRSIAPDLRKDLTRAAASTLDLLERLLLVRSTEDAIQLLPEKAALLRTLDNWHKAVELWVGELDHPEPLSVSFSRFLYSILKIVLLSALDSSPNLYDSLNFENTQLLSMSQVLENRVRAFSSRGEQFKVR